MTESKYYIDTQIVKYICALLWYIFTFVGESRRLYILQKYIYIF